MLKYEKTRAKVYRFADSHPRFDKLARLIKVYILKGFSLEQSYALAVALEDCKAVPMERSEFIKAVRKSIRKLRSNSP